MRQRLLLPCLLPFLACTVLTAEDIIFEGHLPDGHAMWAKAQQGLWKQMLELPSLVALQTHSLKQAGVELPPGKTVWEANPIPESMQFLVTFSNPNTPPRMAARGEYGAAADAAETMWSGMLDQFRQQNIQIPGALRRTGTRLEFDDGQQMPWAAATQIAGADQPDFVGILHPDRLANAFGTFGERIANAFALGPWRADVRLAADGYREKVDLVGRWPAFAAVDYAQLRGIPRKALFGGAIGLDGFAIEEWSLAVAGELPEFTLGLAELDNECVEQGLPPFTDALFGMNGTAWMAILPGAPFPTVTIAIPGGTGVDDFVLALGQRAGVDLTAASTAAVMLPLPQGVPVTLMVRRSGSHWLMSTDMLGIEDFVTGKGEAFDRIGIPALANGKDAVAVAWSDNQLMFQTLTGFMAMAQGAMQRADPAEKEQFAMTLAFIRDFGRIVPSSLGVLTWDDKAVHGLGQNMVMNGAFLVGASAAMALPVILKTKSRATKVRSSNNMKQIVTGMVAWSMDYDGAFPPDLATLLTDVQLPESVLRSPLIPADVPGPHYLYVRPAAEIASWQPVILEDPAHTTDGTLQFAQADGAIRTLRGDAAQAVWAEARRLAVLPKAAKEGIPTADWAAVEAQFASP